MRLIIGAKHCILIHTKMNTNTKTPLAALQPDDRPWAAVRRPGSSPNSMPRADFKGKSRPVEHRQAMGRI
jgi:hypothetical protein